LKPPPRSLDYAKWEAEKNHKKILTRTPGEVSKYIPVYCTSDTDEYDRIKDTMIGEGAARRKVRVLFTPRSMKIIPTVTIPASTSYNAFWGGGQGEHKGKVGVSVHGCACDNCIAKQYAACKHDEHTQRSKSREFVMGAEEVDRFSITSWSTDGGPSQKKNLLPPTFLPDGSMRVLGKDKQPAEKRGVVFIERMSEAGSPNDVFVFSVGVLSLMGVDGSVEVVKFALTMVADGAGHRTYRKEGSSTAVVSKDDIFLVSESRYNEVPSQLRLENRTVLNLEPYLQQMASTTVEQQVAPNILLEIQEDFAELVPGLNQSVLASLGMISDP
jgi:hypothetical protein